jgi:hypothetical protein
MYTFAAVFTVSFILLLIARCSPDEWRNPYPCDMEYDYLENRFTVSNTLWFSIGTLMQQGRGSRFVYLKFIISVILRF